VFREGLEFPEQPGVDYQRPKTYAQCLQSGLGVRGPCPYVSCKHHLFLDVMPSGGLKLNFPGGDPTELAETCALAVAAQRAEGDLTLVEVAASMNLSVSRLYQIVKPHKRRVLKVLDE
jgi:hypothetical protein